LTFTPENTCCGQLQVKITNERLSKRFSL
jgi:hypothetical protein